MSALDRIPDFGERLDQNGQPIDELWSVLTMMPGDDNPDTVMIAAKIADIRLRGTGMRELAKALRQWRPYPEVRN